MIYLLELLCVVLTWLGVFYYYATKNYNFWRNRGIFGPKPVPLFGNFMKIMISKTTKAVVIRELYDAYPNDRIIGIYDGKQPALLLRDPTLFDDVFKKDFSAFGDRGMLIHEKADPFSVDLFCLDVKRWRPVRRKLAPGFSSGRLKQMFHMVIDCADVLDKYLEVQLLKNDIVDIRELFAKYAVNVIGTCAFGIDLKALKDEECEYHKICENALKMDFFKIMRYWLKSNVPWFFDLLGYVLPYTKVTKFFLQIVRDTLDYRKKNNIVKYDFLQQLQEMREHPEELSPIIEVTDTFLAAQAFVFFTAGFDASSIILTNIFYELAQHVNIQEKLREEIRQMYQKDNGVLTYESVTQMSYLDKVFHETLRKHSAITMLHRQSTGSHTFADLGLTVPKGIKVFVSISGLHHDASIFPDPETFDPERFSPEAIASRHPNSYVPFGIGPRMCIGARFSNYMAKVGVCKILPKYRFDVCEKTEIPYKQDPSSILMLPIGGIYLKISKVENN